MKNWSLGKKLNALVIGILIVFAIGIFVVVQQQITSGIQESALHKAESDLEMGYAYIDERYPGEWSIEDEELFKGDEQISNNNDLVDEIGERTGGTVTIFMNDTRVATNVVDDNGERAIDTQAEERVSQTVLEDGEIYSGEAEVVGNNYQTMYQPIENDNGETIGMWYVGASSEFIDETVNSTIIFFTIVLVILGALGIGCTILFSKRIEQRLSSLTSAMQAAGNGDFTHNLQEGSQDEIGQVIHHFNEMKEQLKHLLQRVSESSEQVAGASEQLAANSDQTSSATEQISESIQEVATGAEDQQHQVEEATQIVERLSAVVTQISERIQKVNHSSQETRDVAASGNENVSTAVTQMKQIETQTTELHDVLQRLDDKSRKIGDIITLITNVSEQTNLLALNAAIEAARAGENGKGFAVVADEVRKLAEESNQSAQEIKTLVFDIQAESKEAVTTMDSSRRTIQDGTSLVQDAGTAFQQISASVEDVSSHSNQVAESAEELLQGTEQLKTAIGTVGEQSEKAASHTQNVAATAEEQTASMEEIASSSKVLANQSEDMQQAISHFRFNDAADRSTE